MEPITKLELINKARYIYGFVNILKSDIGILRNEINDSNEKNIRRMISNTNDTLEVLVTLVGELDDMLNLDKTKRS